jgi:tRNA pseudouridine13 synthase
VQARWPRSNPAPLLPGLLKVTPEDFEVHERLGFEPSGEGEHLLLQVSKTGIGTPELGRLLADAHGIDHVDVGYAGMKDKRAVTRQWFSLRGVAELDDAMETIDGVRVLRQARHRQKLRRGELEANDFRIRLRSVDPVAGLAAANRLGETGAPNYFGAQRFGWDNLKKATAWLAQRRRRRISRFKQGLYLSVLRSFLFNEVLAHRVGAGNWHRVMEGDCLDSRGYPTGPLWGRGRSETDALAAVLEAAALTPHQAILEGLEHAGLKQARRSLVLRPEAFSCVALDDGIELSFSLGPGEYATSLLMDRFELDTGTAELVTEVQAAGGGR